MPLEDPGEGPNGPTDRFRSARIFCPTDPVAEIAAGAGAGFSGLRRYETYGTAHHQLYISGDVLLQGRY